MKRALFLLIITFLLSASLYSQAIEYDIKIRYNQEAAGVTADILITVTSGNPDFTYFLMTNHPVSGKVLMQSEPTKKKNYAFKGVKPGKYFIKIEDFQGRPAGKSVLIKDTIDSSN